MEVFNLDLIPGKANPVIHCSQFDEGRAFRAKLFEGASVYTLDGTETITLIEKKLDGNEVTLAVTNTNDSYVDFETTQQLTALAGSQLCELRFEKGADLIGSANFILDCEESPDTGIASDSAIHNLEEQISEAVADQYDSNNVIFDNAPTPGHGVGYCVTSEGTPDELDDLTDVTLTTPTSGEALVYDGAKFVNGTPGMDVSDLGDVTITTPSDDDILVYQNGEWVNMANPASAANFGADYDENTTYNTGDKCIYNGLLYECNSDGVTGTWDATKWDSLTVAGMTAGDLPLGTTTPKGSTAEAIGDLTQLTTTDKSSLVGAVNEVNAKTTSTNTTVDIGSYGDDIQLCKSGKVVLMIINPLSTLPSGGWTQIGTLPSGYEPIIQTISDMYSRDDRHLRIKLDTDRKIYVYNYSSAISSTNNAYWNVTYITA